MCSVCVPLNASSKWYLCFLEKNGKKTLLWSTPLPRSFYIVAVETVPEFEHTTSDGDCLEHTDFAALIKQVTVTTMSDAGKTTTKLSMRKTGLHERLTGGLCLRDYYLMFICLLVETCWLLVRRAQVLVSEVHALQVFQYLSLIHI